MSNIDFDQTCFACPEQYDIIDTDANKRIGYMRLRHGALSISRADDYDIGETVFVRHFPLSMDDDLHPQEMDLYLENDLVNPDGIFEDYIQRDTYQSIARSFFE